MKRLAVAVAQDTKYAVQVLDLRDYAPVEIYNPDAGWGRP